MRDNYNLNQLWRLFSKERTERLILNSFAQSTSFSVFSDKSQVKKPLVNVYLDISANIKLVKLLKKLIESTPNTRLSFVQMRWDPEKRANTVTGTLVFGKSEDGTMYVEASGPQCPTPIVFPFVPLSNVDIEGRTPSQVENSEIAVRSLIKVLEVYVPTAELLSTWNYTPKSNKTQNSTSVNKTENHVPHLDNSESIF